jgi:DNA polymerase-3 subunit beta
MKITIDRLPLIKTLANAQGVIEKRTTIPILANVMLIAKNGLLSMSATDMEIAVTEAVLADVAADGACTVPAAMLYDIARKLPDGSSVTIEHAGGDAPVRLRAGRYSTSLVALPTEDFPSMTAGVLPHKFGVSALALRGLIDRTKFAISTEETRYYLNGIYLHAAESDGTRVLRAVATDGHRLARVEEPLPDGAAAMPGVIIPRKTVAELRKLLDEVSGEVRIDLSDTRIQFRVDAITLTSKLIDGTFPSYEKVIPHGNDRALTVNRAALASAIARVSAISGEKTRPVKLTVSRDLLRLDVRDESGTATEELDSDQIRYDAEQYEAGFQARYLNDILAQITTDAVMLFGSTDAPALVRDAADASALFVIMPLRI